MLEMHVVSAEDMRFCVVQIAGYLFNRRWINDRDELLRFFASFGGVLSTAKEIFEDGAYSVSQRAIVQQFHATLIKRIRSEQGAEILFECGFGVGDIVQHLSADIFLEGWEVDTKKRSALQAILKQMKSRPTKDVERTSGDKKATTTSKESKVTPSSLPKAKKMKRAHPVAKTIVAEKIEGVIPLQALAKVGSVLLELEPQSTDSSVEEGLVVSDFQSNTQENLPTTSFSDFSHVTPEPVKAQTTAIDSASKKNFTQDREQLLIEFWDTLKTSASFDRSTAVWFFAGKNDELAERVKSALDRNTTLSMIDIGIIEKVLSERAPQLIPRLHCWH